MLLLDLHGEYSLGTNEPADTALTRALTSATLLNMIEIDMKQSRQINSRRSERNSRFNDPRSLHGLYKHKTTTSHKPNLAIPASLPRTDHYTFAIPGYINQRAVANGSVTGGFDQYIWQPSAFQAQSSFSGGAADRDLLSI